MPLSGLSSPRDVEDENDEVILALKPLCGMPLSGLKPSPARDEEHENDEAILGDVFSRINS